MINNSHNKYIIFILLQSFLYGLGNPLTKIAFASITPLWCLAFRFGLAFSLFAIFFATRLRKQLQVLSASQYLPAGLCMASAYISCNLALEGTTATNVGFIMSLSVIFAPLLSIIVLQRPYKLSHLPIQHWSFSVCIYSVVMEERFLLTREIYGHCLQQSASQEHWSLEKNL